jgi:hypothetical protein
MFAVEVLSIVILAVLVAVLVGSAVNRQSTKHEQLKERLRALGPDPSLQDLVNSIKEHPDGRRMGG